MLFPPLSSAILLKRYKRFLADVLLPNGEQITLHCPNTGAMTGCANEGDTVWFSTSDNPKRKYAHTWELTQTQAGDFICVNTNRANQLVEEALKQGWIGELAHYSNIFPEQKYGQENSRIDFFLKQDHFADCFVEIKSTTLLTEKGVGMFPDAKTERGQKHLRELAHLAQNGQHAVNRVEMSSEYYTKRSKNTLFYCILYAFSFTYFKNRVKPRFKKIYKTKSLKRFSFRGKPLILTVYYKLFTQSLIISGVYSI